MANELVARMNAALANAVEDRHSLFQLKHFILGKEYTPQGKMWQCLREIRARKDALDTLSLEIEKAKDQLSLIYIEHRRACRALSKRHRQAWEGSDNEAVAEENKEAYLDDVKALDIAIRQIKREEEAAWKSLSALEAKAESVRLEAEFFVDEFEKLNATTPVKSLDDMDSQKEYWTAKLFNEVNLKSLLGLPLDTELVKTVLSLPNGSPVKDQMVSFLNAIRDARFDKNLPQATEAQVK